MDSTTFHRRSRRLQAEVKAIFSYYEDCSELLEAYSEEWYKDYIFLKEACGYSDNSPEASEHTSEDWINISEDDSGDQGSPSPTSDVVDETAEQTSEDFSRNIPTWAKKLYKKIALLTHPDRVASVSQRPKFEKLFRVAAEAFQEERYEDLIPIGLGLNIIPDLADTDLVPILMRLLESTKTGLKKIENSMAWLWCENYGDIDMRYNLFVKALAAEGLKPAAIETIVEFIKTREAQR